LSLEAVLAVIDRATADDGFRELLLADPAKALRGEEVTASERAMLKGLADSPYTASPRGLADVRKMVLASMAYGEG
jgi:hypothetical protein